ncbi:YdiU family protein [Noviherbaspirillum cavernae]|uniref:Protein nucleotidyltransferase YdiU n=1 Tax=Noviherbaspirillum cavernae TaxID=2320862 RepID=A0A418X0M6_9BURK|nr:YdiU family protein [Noviherbaspirillum cavernae]RJG06044.1 YdiU family protein [Noviherbaspirillum cavernae]
MNTPGLPPVRHCIDTLPFENSFASLPPAFYTRLMPTPVPSPYLVCASKSAAALINLDTEQFSTDNFVQTLAGNRTPAGSDPLAAVYSGHQFGVWAGQLGDGRAILLGDVPAPGTSSPGTMELQLKGSGLTPYSRMGDGRAVLRSSIREFLCSEAMAALGIPTSRALCVTGSDMRVMRETPETSAIATRMAPTFVRFGSFEHWFYNGRKEELKILADYVIDRFYPELCDAANPYHALLSEVTRRTAHLIAQWQAVGFMHGVMNTDNMSILGQTIDYGPFGFMEAFDIRHICNHSDPQGRYSYQMQPRIGEWNCYALGQALLPLVGDVETTKDALQVYQPEYERTLSQLLHAKLGLQSVDVDDDGLIDAMFILMQNNHVDFTLFFRRLGDLRIDDPSQDEALRDLFLDRPAFDAWAVQYRTRLRQENRRDAERKAAMHAVNPKYVLRNYLAQVAIEKAQNKDFSEIARLLDVLEKPFDEQPENEKYANLPPDWASQLEVSCSS